MADFIYCLNSSTIRPTPILEKIRIAGETGYKAIELWHDDIDAHLAGGGKLADIKKALADQGLAVPTTIYVKGWFDSTGAEHAAALEEAKRRMHQSAELGGIHIIAGPPGGKADHDLGARNYRELLEIGLKIGVKPAMEYLGFVDDINNIEAAAEIVEKAGHPQGTVIHDPFHIFRGGGSFESLLKVPADRIAISHFNDAPASPPRPQQHDKDRVYPGDGHLDLRGMVRLLKQVGYNRWLSLELFNEKLWALNPAEVARTGLEKMRAVVETA
jgi:sugar phosphate isomerase/epimerase